MTDLPNEPPIEWLNAFGRGIYEAWGHDQEYALTLAQRIWKEPRFAQMSGEEAVKTWLRDWQKERDRLYGAQEPVDAWVEAYQNEWATLCNGEWDFESPYEETYDLWHKHYHRNPKVVAMERFLEVYTPEERERYRQLTQKKPWIDVTA